MLSKNAVKYYSTLLSKKYRERERKFIVEGKRLVEEALQSEYKCEILICTSKYAEDNSSDINKLESKIQIEIVKEADFKRLSDTKNPQGIIGVFLKGKINFVFDPTSNFILGLENISDPGNVGTIIRNADWFGIKQVILSEECADIFNQKVLRASMGSVFHINFSDSIDFYSELMNLKSNGYIITVADMVGENIYDFGVNKKLVLILCNEAHGPSKKILDLCDYKITIPRKGKAESLNVASASAVLLNELTKSST